MDRAHAWRFKNLQTQYDDHLFRSNRNHGRILQSDVSDVGSIDSKTWWLANREPYSETSYGLEASRALAMGAITCLNDNRVSSYRSRQTDREVEGTQCASKFSGDGARASACARMGETFGLRHKTLRPMTTSGNLHGYYDDVDDDDDIDENIFSTERKGESCSQRFSL